MATQDPIQWKKIKNSRDERLRCTDCDSVAMEVRSVPVAKKRHTPEANRLPTIALCLSCKKKKVIYYGAPIRN